MKFMMPYSGEVQNMALWLRTFVWDIYPECNELIYDNYNALAFGWSVTDRLGHTFCSIAVGTTEYVHFGFYWGYGSAGTQLAQFDNYAVALTPVPEPGTAFGVGALGFAAAALARRRRRGRAAFA